MLSGGSRFADMPGGSEKRCGSSLVDKRRIRADVLGFAGAFLVCVSYEQSQEPPTARSAGVAEEIIVPEEDGYKYSVGCDV